jgi:23S rRNA pseudouridine955/2504/2580 synthase
VPGDRIEAGQEIRVPPAEAVPERTARPQPKREHISEEEEQLVRDMVIHEDANAFVLNKPPGLATQGGTKTHQHLDRLLDGLASEAGRPKLVHRLDKDTSGALLVAKTARSAGHFAKAFSGRTARKIYWALVVGVPERSEGIIDAPLAKQPGTGGEKMHISEEHGLPAKTRWRVIDRAGNRAAWVELQPLTGRTHQLRAHMAAIGHPIVGDAKYGGAEAFLTGGISRKLHLHARRIRIDAPDGRKIDVTAELPPHFAETLATLGFEPLAGDSLPLEPPKASPEAKQRKVAAAAKARRRERRGERRARGSSSSRPRGKR